MLAGVRAAAVGSGPRQRAVFAGALQAQGGELVDLQSGRVCPLFSAAQRELSDPLLEGLTHVLVEDWTTSRSALLRELRGSSTFAAQLVHSSWLSDSLRLGSRQDEAAYLLRLSSPSKRKLDADPGSAAGPGEPGRWSSLDDSVRYRLHCDGERVSGEPARLLCLDLDGTVIRTRSGRVFARDEFDWVPAAPQHRCTSLSSRRSSLLPASPASSEPTAPEAS